MAYLTVSDTVIAAYAPLTSRVVEKLRDNVRVMATQHCALEAPVTATEPVWSGIWDTYTSVDIYFPAAVAGEGGTRLQCDAILYASRNAGAAIDGTLSARLYHADSGAYSNELFVATDGASTTNTESGTFTIDLTLSAAGFNTIGIQTKGEDSGVGVPTDGHVELTPQVTTFLISRLPAEGY